MVTVILFALVGWFLAVRKELDLSDFRDDFFISVAGVFILGAKGIVIGALSGFLIAWALPCVSDEDTREYKIVNLQDSNTFNGHCFLGTGSINNEMVYTFYYEENGAYKLMQINVGDASIKYTTGRPTAIWIGIKDTPSYWFWNQFAIDFYCASWILEVPDGSIQNNYTLNAQ